MISKDTVVEVENIKKTFNIPLEASSGIKQKLINQLKGRKGYREFSPLNGISFQIKEGDFFGIVGRNGSGKSTLLKTIAGIYTPTNGEVKVKGTLIPFIELGVGFNPELTGRENVFLNGALLGFSRKEMEDMYKEIVDFAELHDFMEERLKNYSSGMQVRLAFSIAIRADGDILLLDEVLAVGDESFQRKCFSYFDKLKRHKKTVILVTHDMASVERFCTKAMMIEDGAVKLIGSPYEVATAYSRSNDESYSNGSPDVQDSLPQISTDTQDTYGLSITIKDDKTLNKKLKFTTKDNMIVELKWQNPDITEASVSIVRQSGEVVFGTGTYQDKFRMGVSGDLSFTVNLNLSEGDYFLRVGLGKDGQSVPAVLIDEGPAFIVNRDKSHPRWEGYTELKHSWSN
jgi:ABC-2 type transport system ATP-binding protein